MKIGDIISVTIEQLNDDGHGVAAHLTYKIVVPYALPGEIVKITITKITHNYCLGSILEQSSTNPERVQPPCPYFGECGGCTLQHMSLASYRDYKNTIFNQVLSQNDLQAEQLRPTIFVGPQNRRRVTFQVQKQQLGFFAHNSHNLVPISSCMVIVPQIQQLLPILSKIITKIAKISAVSITVIKELIEINFHCQKEINLASRQILVDFAYAHRIARICYQIDGQKPEIICQIQPLKYSSVSVPPASFVQATKIGLEQIIEDILGEAQKKVKKAVDLYAGCGAYSLPLQAVTKVDSFEGEKSMMEALRKIALPGLTAHQRDLYKYPLSALELKPYTLAVINPPRKGATPQIINLAKARVPKIIMVSCNISSFARDAKILCDNSYKITWARVIDQFLWTNHLECVACFELT